MNWARDAKSLHALAIPGVIAPPLFAALVGLAGSLRPGYSHVAEPISVLGAFGTPFAIVQQANFVVTGLLIGLFGLGLYHGIENGRPAKIGSGFVVGMGVGLVGSGVFSLDLCSPACTSYPDITNILHGLMGIILVFIGFIVASFMTWRGLKKDSRWQDYETVSLGLAVAYLALFFPMFVFFDSPWNGAYQRVQVGIFLLWFEVMAVGLWKITGQPRDVLPGASG